MTQTNQTSAASPKVVTKNSISKVWLIPLLAIGIGCWMIADTYLNKGPEIVITFPNAEGLEAGKTRVKTLNVDIGYVDRVLLNEDRTGVVVHVSLDNQVRNILGENALFWVVRPRIGNGGISGLGTLMSGSYIEFVGDESDKMTHHFNGLDEEPITATGIAGTRLKLVGEQGDSVSTGDPVMYRGFEVGRVERSTFDIDSRKVHYQIFVKSPYSQLLTENTYFWNTSGVDFSATTEGINVNIDSLESLVRGGISFDVPTDLSVGGEIDETKSHILYPDKDSVYEQRKYLARSYVILFEDSVRGLQVGAPVEYRGIRLGTVKKVLSLFALDINRGDQERRIPVIIDIEPARIGYSDSIMSINKMSSSLESKMAQGLKASLKSGNLLTGSLFIDLNFYADAKGASQPKLEQYDKMVVIPSMSGSLAQIEQKVFSILDKFENMPIDVTIDSINKMLDNANSTMVELNQAVFHIKQLLSHSETQAIPQHINDTLDNLSKTLNGFNQQAPVYGEVEQTLQQFQQLMREIQPLVKELNNKPNSLIFESKATDDPEPKGK